MDATSSTPLPTSEGGPPLPEDVASCHRVIHELWAENRQLRARVVELEAKVEQLEAKLDALLRRSFASRSERSKQARKANRDADDKPKKKRHEHGRKPLPAHLQRREVIHDLTDEQKKCPCCGQPRVCIGTHSVEQLDCDPIPFFVRKTTRKTYACQACKPSDVPGKKWSQTSGPAKVGPIPKGLCGPGLACWAHARRKFLEAGDSARPAVEFIRRLYRVERTLPEPDTPEHIAQRKAIRHSQSVAILESLKAWLESESKSALPKSPLGAAIAYVLNRWKAFERYTEEGDLSIDNRPHSR